MQRHCFIIAEAGVNHNGRLNLAKKLVDAAKRSGADAVKFQTFKAEEVVCASYGKANYQKKTTAADESQLTMLKRLELKEVDFRELSNYCQKTGILFLSTAFDMASVDVLDQLGVTLFKIPSGEITNGPLLTHIAKKNKPIILSTGMSTLKEIDQALKILRRFNKKNISLLHCVSEYPAPMEDVNLKAIPAMQSHFKLSIGLSDHTLGIEVPIAAVALGASIIEKHMTLTKTMNGPDHQASLDPQEFSAMVKAIRHIEKALGNGHKQPSKSELKNRIAIRRSLVSTKDIPKGSHIEHAAIAIKRPGSGIAPNDLGKILGRQTKRSIKKDTVIKWDYLA